MIVLASQSPRRKELLKSLNIDFISFSPKVDEKSFDDPYSTTKTNSVLKYNACKKSYPDAYIIAADTVVYHNKKVLSKPLGRSQALDFLKQLSSSTHEVITSITMGYTPLTYSFVTKVTFYNLSNDIINFYLNTNEWVDKAGAYAIQGYGKILVERISGDYFNVVGLPISFVWQRLLLDGFILK